MGWMARIGFAMFCGGLCLLIGCEELGTPASSQAAAPQPGETREIYQPEKTQPVEHTTGFDDLGSIAIGTIDVQVLRGRGEPAPGGQLRLIVKVPDDAATSSVRGWIGTASRFASAMAGADYSEQLGGYELRTTAPDPLPPSAAWWIEVERADGTTHVGSVPLR